MFFPFTISRKGLVSTRRSFFPSTLLLSVLVLAANTSKEVCSRTPDKVGLVCDGARGVFVALHSPYVCSESEVYSSSVRNFVSQTVYARPSRWPPPAQMFFSVKSMVNSQQIQRSLDGVLTLTAEVIEKTNHAYLSAAAIPIVTYYLFYSGVVVPTYGNYVVMCGNAAMIGVNPGLSYTLFCGFKDSLKFFSGAPTSATFVFSVKLFSYGPITAFYCCWLLIEIILPICGIITVHFILYSDSGLGHTTPSSFQTCFKLISCPYSLYCLRVWHQDCAYYEEFRTPNWIFPYVMVLRNALVPQDYSLGCCFYILALDNCIIYELCPSCSPSGYVSISQDLAAYMKRPRPPTLNGVVARIHKALLVPAYTEDANTILLEDLIRKDDSKTQVFLALSPTGTSSNVALRIGRCVVKVPLMVVHKYKLISPDAVLVPKFDFANCSDISGCVHNIQDKGGTSSCFISAAFSINEHLMLYVPSILSIDLRHIHVCDGFSSPQSRQSPQSFHINESVIADIRAQAITISTVQQASIDIKLVRDRAILIYDSAYAIISRTESSAMNKSFTVPRVGHADLLNASYKASVIVTLLGSSGWSLSVQLPALFLSMELLLRTRATPPGIILMLIYYVGQDSCCGDITCLQHLQCQVEYLHGFSPSTSTLRYDSPTSPMAAAISSMNTNITLYEFLFSAKALTSLKFLNDNGGELEMQYFYDHAALSGAVAPNPSVAIDLLVAMVSCFLGSTGRPPPTLIIYVYYHELVDNARCNTYARGTALGGGEVLP